MSDTTYLSLVQLARNVFLTNWEGHRSVMKWNALSALAEAVIAVLIALTPPNINFIVPAVFLVVSFFQGRLAWKNFRQQQAYERALVDELQSEGIYSHAMMGNVLAENKTWTKDELVDALGHVANMHKMNRLLARVDAYKSFDDDKMFGLTEKLRELDENASKELTLNVDQQDMDQQGRETVDGQGEQGPKS